MLELIKYHYFIHSVLYWSFDTLENLTLMEGSEKSNFSALVAGKVRLNQLYVL